MGLILYPVFKLSAGKWREIGSGTWVIFGMSLLFFLVYPY
jgi:xanthine/uracil/vitamin C permease (AzgA family)